jgi:hypothetical protein
MRSALRVFAILLVLNLQQHLVLPQTTKVVQPGDFFAITRGNEIWRLASGDSSGVGETFLQAPGGAALWGVAVDRGRNLYYAYRLDDNEYVARYNNSDGTSEVLGMLATKTAPIKLFVADLIAGPPGNVYVAYRAQGRADCWLARFGSDKKVIDMQNGQQIGGSFFTSQAFAANFGASLAIGPKDQLYVLALVTGANTLYRASLGSLVQRIEVIQSLQEIAFTNDGKFWGLVSTATLGVRNLVSLAAPSAKAESSSERLAITATLAQGLQIASLETDRKVLVGPGEVNLVVYDPATALITLSKALESHAFSSGRNFTIVPLGQVTDCTQITLTETFGAKAVVGFELTNSSGGRPVVDYSGGAGYRYPPEVTGSLPDGLEIGPLDAGGISIKGIPTKEGEFNFTIKVTDAAGCTGSKSFKITVIGVAEFLAPDVNQPSFTGGVYVATGDVNGDRVDDIIVGGEQNVTVSNLVTGATIAQFTPSLGPLNLAVAPGETPAESAVVIGTQNGAEVWKFTGDTFKPGIVINPGVDNSTISVGNFTGSNTADLVTVNNTSMGNSFVVSLYKDFLNRKQETANVPDLFGSLNGGNRVIAISPSNVGGTPNIAVLYRTFFSNNPTSAAISILNSDEHRRSVVERAYIDLLGRADDPAGLVLFGDSTAVLDRKTALITILNSQEYFSRPKWNSSKLQNRDLPAIKSFPVGIDPSSMTLGDFNGDGRADLAVSNSGSNNVSILLGDGVGNFSAPINVAVGTNPVSISAGDFNGDGKQDLVVANKDSRNLSVLINRNNPLPLPAANFAQFSDGEGITSTVTLVDPSKTFSATGTLKSFSRSGGPLSVDVFPGGKSFFSVPPLGVRTFSTTGTGKLITGSLQLAANLTVGANVLFSGKGLGVAGVPAVTPLSNCIIPIESDASKGVRTGFAFSNSGSSKVDITLRLRQAGGALVPNGTAVVSVAANGQLAQFPEEVFAGKGIDFSKFRGTLEVTAPQPVSGMAIRLSPGQLATLPVIGVGSKRLLFGQFGEALGISSTMTFVNPSTNKTANVTAKINDDNGAPLIVNLNGTDQPGQFTFTIPPQGTVNFSTPGTSAAIKVGSVVVDSTENIGGVITFGGNFGLAGFDASQALQNFIAPVEQKSNGGVTVGLALMSAAGKATTVKLTLRDESGNAINGGSATVSLAASGHVARNISQFFPNLNLADFRGTITGEATDLVAVTVVRQSTAPLEYAALPATPIIP